MSQHRKIRLMLYEFLQDDLPLPDRQRVETHVASCRECRRELDAMRSTLGMMNLPVTRASEERPEQYWEEFSITVVQRAITRRLSWGNPFVEIIEWIEELFLLHRGYSFAATGTLAALLVIFALWTFHTPRGQETPLDETSVSLEHRTTPAPSFQETMNQTAVPSGRVGQYFRKSKTLLVGLTNLRSDGAEPQDFSAERRVSRGLLQETRYLKKQPIDPRSRRLMNDMEGILIELSNIDGNKDVSNMDIIRSGIHHGNLLFKVRMAEAMYDSAHYQFASEHR